MEGKYLVTSFYRFFDVAESGLPALRDSLLSSGAALELRGQIILASEGANGTVSGAQQQVETFKRLLSAALPAIVRPAAIELDEGSILFKDSFSDRPPFQQWTVKIRPEVVTSTIGPAGLAADQPHYLTPAEWRERLRSDNEAIVLDTRNRYETSIGKFETAIDPGIDSFRDFEDTLKNSDIPRNKPVLIYCTGGIRCEKAEPILRRLGFREVYQLHGGILKFLEEFPEDAFKGECFVFDERVALDQHLRPTNAYGFCPHCGQPASVRISCRRCGETAPVCGDCLVNPDRPQRRNSCSKNCANILATQIRPAAQ